MERVVLEQLDALRKNFKDKQAELFDARAALVEFGRKHIKPIECDTCGCQIPYGIDIVCMEDLDGKRMHFCCKCCFQEFRHVTVEDLKSQMYDKLFVDNCNEPKLLQEKKMSDNRLINSEIDAFAIRNGLTDAACYAIKCICRAEKDKEYRNVRSEAGLLVDNCNEPKLLQEKKDER